MTFRPTGRQLTAVGLAAAFAMLPPLVTRAAPDLLTEFRGQVLTIGACFAAMAMSLNLLMGYAGQISLGHGALLGVGAYTAGIVTGRYYLPMGLGLVLAAAIGGAIALIVGLPALRLRGLYLAATTIAFTVVMEESIFKIAWLSRGSAGVEIPRPYLGSFGFLRNGDYLALVLVIVLVLWLIDVNVVRTKLGRAFHGIREDEQVAQSFGVDVARYKLGAFVLSGVMAGIAGALYGHLIGFVDSETFSFQRFSLLLVVLVVIGGLGNRTGVVVAAAVYSVLPELLRSFEGWDLMLGAALLIYTVARHPGGLAEAFREAREARAVRAARRATADDDDSDAVVPALPDLPRPSTLPAGLSVAQGAPLLEIDEVGVRFGGLVAVDGASLVVPQGLIVGLIGPNGAGKSTLFNAVSGFVPIERGRVRLGGRDIQNLPSHERARLGIGRTFQHIGLARNLSVLENLMLAQHPAAGYDVASALGFLPRAGRVEAELEARSRATITALGFDALSETPVRNLSGGQQRIVELACALVTAPELLMLDEPSAGMAPAAVENLATRLRELRDDLGRTVLLIEHHIPLVLDVCDHVYVLDQGTVLAEGTPAEVTSNPLVVAAYLGGDLSLPAKPKAPRKKAAAKKVAAKKAAAVAR